MVTTLTRCSIHELLNCAVCNGDARRFEKSIEVHHRTKQGLVPMRREEPAYTLHTARYESICPCGAAIVPGDQYARDAEGSVVCQTCAEQ